MTAILIVDDSLTVRMDLADSLEAAGFVAIPVATLRDARAALAAQPIAAAILDVRLPDGDGVMLLAEIRNDPSLAALPVLMLSTEAEVKDRIRGLRTGANDYVGKPYDTDVIVARIRELVFSDRTGTDQIVLLIDDSPTYRATLSEALTAAGYVTLGASNGSEGLRLAAARRPAVIVVDGEMPGMDGSSVVRRIRLDPVLRTTPCVLLTGSDDEGAELRALDAGADAFVRKGSDLEVILARVGAVLRATSGEQHTGATSSLGPKRILAVDDSATYLNELGDQLRDVGYDVVLASSGEEAIELLAVQHVDCILLDRMMPGLSGADTCMRIKSAPTVRDIPLVMLTALDGRDAMIDGLAVGADDFISKSSGLDVLKARVQAQIRRKQFEDEHRRVRERLLRSEHEAEEAQAARELAEMRAAMAERLERANLELQATNRELEAFSYSVSHDLQGPLRSISGFSTILVEDYADQLDEPGRTHVRRIVEATERMTTMIEDLLRLSRIASGELQRDVVDLSALARAILSSFAARDSERRVEVEVAAGVTVHGDTGLLRTALENLLGNAWKFTGKRERGRIEFGTSTHDGQRIYFVRDNGAGFNMQSADLLFRPFQRLHRAADFAGTGIGLATVQRVIVRHGGRIWAEAEPDVGATFFFVI